MEAVLDSSVVNHLGQLIGELTGSGGSILEPGDDPVAASTPAGPAGEEAIVVSPVALSFKRIGKRHQVTARLEASGDVVALDTLDLARAGQRQRFIEHVLEKMGLAEAEANALEHGLDQALLQFASSPATTATTGHAAATEAEFRVIDNAADPELNGLYATMPPAQICNFHMQILEHVVVEDEDRPETRLRMVIRRGQERSLEMTGAEFASNSRLRTVVYGSALPGADLKVGADVLRRAIIALSQPTIRRTTTATGWTADRSRFLVPGGFVDADGYHNDDPALDIP
jgi:hypothetical protein